MTKHRAVLAAGAATVALGLLAAGPAVAGPCAEQISEVSRMLSNDPAMGPATTGALAGAAPGAIQGKAPMPQQGAPEGAAEPTGEGVKGKAVATTMAGNAPGSMSQPLDPAAGKATSAQDVRLQQKGQPTMAQGGDPAKAGENVSQAKMALESARALDQQGSQDCMGKVDEARKLLQGS